MRMVLGGALAAMVVLGAAPAMADDLMKKAQENLKPIPSMVPAVKDNAVTHEKVELGKLLFFDPRLSASEIISCNTCHNVGTGGVDAGPTWLDTAGRRGRAARRRSITPSSISPSSGTGAPPTSKHRRKGRYRPAWR